MVKKDSNGTSRTRDRTMRPAQVADPLTAWCTVRAEAFTERVALQLRASIATVAIIGEPSWRAAVGGDAAAAIGLALRLHPGRSSPTAYSLVMTALAACAADGNSTACAVMGHVLNKCTTNGRSHSRLAASWSKRAFKQIVRQCRGGTSS